MSSENKTVPLSQIVDHAVNETHPSPNIKAFKTVNRVINALPSAQVALRVQMIAKMKAYKNKLLSLKEMYYALCLIDYCSVHCAAFRSQVMVFDFIELFEKL